MSSSLNHAYRLVWNEQSQAYVPAPETVKARGKRSGSKKALVAAALSLSMAVGVSAADLPTGGQIVSGSGSITQSGSTMTVTQDTSKLVANWDSFSIGSGNTVNFLQPSSTAIALNRVLGSDVSVIQGAINANGQVFLINPNGVLFTQTAQVNVGGLLASTLNISTEDFLAGKYTFAGGSSNAIINQGNITAAPGGYVALIAAKIENAGNITAQGGSVLMGAGSRVTVDFGGPVKIEVEEGALETLISNGGAIRADGGLVYLTAKAAGDLASSVINHTGVIEARTLETGQTGKVMLMGDMSVGQLSMTGKIDVSAPVAGNGGFVETSAANVYVADSARVNATAVWGVTGDWLIDPTNFTIASGTGALTTSSIGASTLSTNLGSSNVTIQTSSTKTTGNLGDITVAADVTWSSGNTLTLQAHNNITLSSGVTITGSNLKLDTYTLLSKATAPGIIDTSAGTLIISGLTTVITGAGNVNLTGAKNNFGTVAVTSSSGNVSLVDVDSLILGASTVGGTLGVTTAGALTQSGAATITGATTINAGSGDITLTNASNDFSSIALTTKGNASVTDGNALVLGTSAIDGTLSITAAGALTQSGAATIKGAATINTGTSGGAITLTNASNDFSSIALTTTGNASVTDSSGLILGASTVGGTLGVTTAGALTQSGAATITGATTINAGSGDITLTNASNDFSSIALTTKGNASVTDGNALVLGTSAIDGTLSITAAGALTQSGAATIKGAATINTGTSGGAITLTNASNDFSSIALTTTGNASVTDSSGLILGASTVGGTLGVTTAGALTQSGAVTVTGLTTINTGKNIGPVTLDNVNNDFSNIVITTAGNASVADKNGINFGVTDVGGSLSVTAGGAIDLSNASNKVVGAIALSGSSATVVNTVNTVLGATNLSGDLSISIGKLALTQTGDVVVGGATSLTAAAVTLDRSGNDFSSIALTTTGNASVTDKNALVLGASTVGGTLGVTTAGALTQSGAATITGATTINAGSGDITLTNASNDFSSIALTTKGNASVTDGNALVLGTSAIDGTLSITAAGALTQSGAATIKGAATINTGTSGGAITLTNASNDFSSIALTTTGNASVTDSSGLILGASTVGGTLGVTTAGALTQSGAATITGATTINAGSGDITLTNASNDFSSIALTTKGNASVTDGNALVLGTSAIDGTLSITAAGALTQSGAATIKGAATINTGTSGGAITLTNASNDFSSIALTTTGNASVTDSSGLILGASTVGGTLGVTTAGALTQSGAVTVTGLTTINTGKNIGPVTLDNVNNDFSNIVITTAGNASVADKNGINFGVTDVGGSLSVTAGGAIDLSNASNKVVGAIALSGSSATVVNTVNTVLGATNLSGDLSISIGKLALTQTGDVVVGGATSLTAAAVTLDRSGNDFSSIALTTTGNASVTDKNALVLGTSTVGGDLSLITSGDITQTGALSVAGLSNIKANAADIKLNNESNQFVGEVTLAGNNIDIMNQGDLKIAGVNAQGLVSLSSTSGDLYVSGDVATNSTDLTAVSIAALTPGYEVLFENKGSNYPQIKTGDGGGWKILTDSLVSKKSGTVYSYPAGVDPDQFFGVKNDNGDYVADTLNKDASGIGILSLGNGATANRVYYRSAPLTVSISGMDGMALAYGTSLDTKDLVISVSSIGGGTLTQRTLDRIAREVKGMLTYGEFSASNSDYAVMMLAESGLLKGDAGAWGWGLTRNTSRNGTLLTLASGYGADCSGVKCIQVTAKDLSFMDKGPQGFQTWDKFFDGTDIAYLKEIGLLKDYGQAGIESGDLAGLQLALTNAQAYYLSKNGSTFTSSAAGDFNAVINAFLAGKNTTGYESPGGATGAAAGHQKMVGIYLQGSLTGTRARNYNVNWVSIDKSSIYTMDMILNVNNVIRYQGDNYPNFGYSVSFQCTSDACRVRDWGNLWNNGTGLSFRDEQFRGDHGAFADAIARSYSNGTGRYQIVNPFGRFVPYYDPLDTSLYASGFYPKEMYFGGVPRNPTELDPNGVLLSYGGNPGWNLIEHNPGDLTVIPRVLGAGPIQVTQFSNNGSSAPSAPGTLDSLNYVGTNEDNAQGESGNSQQLADLNVNTFTAGTFSPTDVFVVNGGINNGLALGKNK